VPIFRSKQAEDADKIAVRLAAARTTLDAAERDLAARLPEIILGDDHSTLALLQARVQDARERCGLIELAYRQAVQREQDRLGEARLRARKAEDRAFRQHVAAVRSAAESVQRIVAEYQASWLQLVDAADRARRLLPADAYRNFGEIFEARLATAVATELARVGRRNELMGWGAGPSLPGSSEGIISASTAPASVPSLTDHIGQITRFYADRFRDHLALPAAPDRIEPAAVEPEPIEPIEEPVVDPSVANTAELAAGAVTINAPVSVVAGAEPAAVEPHEPGSPEAAGYQQALAEIARGRRPSDLVEAL
jgi:hypothetical protein